VLSVALDVATAALVVAMLLCGWRLLRGPAVCDRILALDTLYVNATGLLVVEGIAQRSSLYFEAALLVAALGFIGTVALSKYVLSRNLIE
jgi:multicomponent K+:H+ antiporter subunit F